MPGRNYFCMVQILLPVFLSYYCKLLLNMLPAQDILSVHPKQNNLQENTAYFLSKISADHLHIPYMHPYYQLKQPADPYKIWQLSSVYFLLPLWWKKFLLFHFLQPAHDTLLFLLPFPISEDSPFVHVFPDLFLQQLYSCLHLYPQSKLLNHFDTDQSLLVLILFLLILTLSLLVLTLSLLVFRFSGNRPHTEPVFHFFCTVTLV